MEEQNLNQDAGPSMAEEIDQIVDEEQIYEIEFPTCTATNGSECPAGGFWRGRYEEDSSKQNVQIIKSHNQLKDYEQLSSRLAHAERTVRMYQQRLFDSLNSIDPIKKDLEEAKSQLSEEKRQREEYQCQAESSKAAAAQLQAYIDQNEAKSTNLRTQLTQIQAKETEKAAETKKYQERATALEAKYQKVKDEVKALREELSKMRKAAENPGQSVRRRRVAQINGQSELTEHAPSDDDANSDFDGIAADLETELAAQTDRSPPKSTQPTRFRPPHPPTRRSDTANTAISAPRTKALAVLERKERQEADGTYAGGSKPRFIAITRPPPRINVLNRPKETGVKRKGDESIQARSIDNEDEMTAEEALAEVAAALFDVTVGPPLSPIADFPESAPTFGFTEALNLEKEPTIISDTDMAESMEVQDENADDLNEIVATPAELGDERSIEQEGAAEANEQSPTVQESTQSSEAPISMSVDESESMTTDGFMSPSRGCLVISEDLNESTDGAAALEIVDNGEEATETAEVSNVIISEGNASAMDGGSKGANAAVGVSKMATAPVSRQQDRSTGSSRPATTSTRTSTTSAKKTAIATSASSTTPRRGRPPKTAAGDGYEMRARAKTQDFGMKKMANRPRSVAEIDTTPCKEADKKQPLNRAYSAVLQAMLEGAGTTTMSALGKWLEKPKQSAEIVAKSLLEAIVRWNGTPWIGTQMITITKPKAVGDKQDLPTNDKKLIEFVCGLGRAEEKWTKLFDVLLTQVERQFGSMGTKVLTAGQRGALYRWAFYLCREQRSVAGLSRAKSVLWMVTQRQSNHEDQSVLNAYITLGLVWPEAFKRLVVEARGDADILLQAVFRNLLSNSPSKAKLLRVLEQPMRNLGVELLWSNQPPPDLEFFVRENLARLSDVQTAANVTEQGLRLAIEAVNMMEKLKLLVPYCQGRHTFVEDSLKSIKNWHSISADDAAARGGFKQLIVEMIFASRFASFYSFSDPMLVEMVMFSLRSMVFSNDAPNRMPDAIDIDGEERKVLICAALEFVCSLPVASFYGKLMEMEEFATKFMVELGKVDELEEKVKQYYGNRIEEFKRRVKKSG